MDYAMMRRSDPQQFSTSVRSPRPNQAAQGELSETINQGPRVAAQRALIEQIHNSPKMAAQRKQVAMVGNVAQRRSFTTGLSENNIGAPRAFTETAGAGQLAGGGQADLVVAGALGKSANLGKALNQAADRFAEVGTKTNAINAAYPNGGNFAAWNDGNTPNALEPFIYRLKVPYTKGKKTNQIELDYQLANGYYGYVVRQKDTGDTSASTITPNALTNADTEGQVDTFNMAHASTGSQAVGTNLEQDTGRSRETNEARIDARTKLAGEGSRWLLVRNHSTTIADDSRIWTRHKGKVYSVSFKTLWLSWADVFAYGFDIPDAVVADKLVTSSDWADAPDVVKGNRWEAKGRDIQVNG